MAERSNIYAGLADWVRLQTIDNRKAEKDYPFVVFDKNKNQFPVSKATRELHAFIGSI